MQALELPRTAANFFEQKKETVIFHIKQLSVEFIELLIFEINYQD